jgi:molecular chaperone GrpE (heat shock protein)
MEENITSEEITEILLNTREQGQMIEQLIEDQIKVKDAMIDRLHEELTYYKSDSADRFADQLMKAVIKVRKDMGRLMASDRWEGMTAEEIKREYGYIFEDITDLLEQQNVDPYRTDPGEEFDAAIHQPKLEATDRQELDRTVKESLSEGYKKGDRVLQPERVVVYQYKA